MQYPRASILITHRTLQALYKGRTRGLRGGGARGVEFVFFDFGGDAGFAVIVRFHAHHVAVAANVHVARGNNLLGKRQDKINLVALFKGRLNNKIKATIADVARVGFKFRAIRIVYKHADWQIHRETPGFAPVGKIAHSAPWTAERGEISIGSSKLQCQSATI